VRLFWSYHMTNAINSITHMFGYRTWPTPEQSRNNLWLGLPTLGEAWHNNHHAWPAAAIFGLRWWEIDLGGLVIRLLEQTGLAWNVRRAPRRRQ
jgi:stearoyl-CoA desaturase (delta-9 desaturase)